MVSSVNNALFFEGDVKIRDTQESETGVVRNVGIVFEGFNWVGIGEV